VEDFRALGKRLSNWGRWGADDEKGTINHITPERLVEAGKLIKQGKIFDLGIPMDQNGPQKGGGRINPVHLMSQTGQGQNIPGGFHFADDYIFMPLQGSSQWDGLAHVYYDDQLYNGFPASDVGLGGAEHDSITAIAKGVAGRGVLLDIARLKGVDWLNKGYVITPEDLEAAAAKQGVEIKPGDILLFRTGWRKMFKAGNPEDFMSGEPGLGIECCEWVYSKEISAICSDNWAIEVIPGQDPGVTLPVHMVLIRDLGVTLGEILDFDELADDCAADGVYEFFFCCPPLKVTKAVGSPINPLAMK